MNNKYKNVFAKYSDELKKNDLKEIKLREEYDDSRLLAKCEQCDKYQRENYGEDKHANCSGFCIGKCGRVKKAYGELYKVLSDGNICRERYAKAIFDELSASKPDLICRKDKSTVKWDDAYGPKFDQLETSQKNSIIALIEEDGGRYRIKE